VIAHEIAHLIRHLNHQNDTTKVYVDDLDAHEKLDDIELEADAVANEALIPKSEWTKSKIYDSKSVDEVIAFAKKIQVDPAIVAGRIRHEKKNYKIFSQLIGKRRVSLP
jgi:HTH-type transcriptional regulator/antitoxin HigA